MGQICTFRGGKTTILGYIKPRIVITRLCSIVVYVFFIYLLAVDSHMLNPNNVFLNLGLLRAYHMIFFL